MKAAIDFEEAITEETVHYNPSSLLKRIAGYERLQSRRDMIKPVIFLISSATRGWPIEIGDEHDKDCAIRCRCSKQLMALRLGQ